MLSEGFNKHRITLQKLVEVTSLLINAAKVFGVYPRKGGIAPGVDADLVIVDPKKSLIVRGGDLHSSAGWTHYEGREMREWPILTVVRGKTVA